MGNLGQGQTIRVVAQETLTSLCSTDPPASPHQSLFSPDRADQWPRVMVVSSFVRRYSTARHCDGLTRPERLRGGRGDFWVGMEGGDPKRVFFLMSVRQVKEGIRCLGLGNGLPETDSSAPPLSCQKPAKELPLLPHICQLHVSEGDSRSAEDATEVTNNTTPESACFYE